MRFSFRVKSVFPLATGLLFLSQAFASSTERLNLPEMVRRSGRIFAGKCVAAERDFLDFGHGQKVAITRYIFEAKDVIKGRPAATIEFKTLSAGVSENDGLHYLRFTGMPSLQIGQEYVLLLTAESRIGLSAPVGLQQGCFRILTDRSSGEKKAVNGLNNAGLFEKDSEQKLPGRLMKIAAQPDSGPIELQTFCEILKELAIH